ncbi:MAG: RagB/SusD family nutrient uptake outer membrane protein [Gemmatirosa sp.]|nr:RagB/SusD family nutrient uptake outer membrane protein [Gemmatirosa sp.]
MATTTKTARAVAALGMCAALGATAGCRDVLDVQPKTFYGTTNFYQNPSQIDQAVLAVYSRLQTVYGSGLGNAPLWVMAEMRSDNTTYQFNPADRSNLAVENIDEFLVTADNAPVSSFWGSSYTPINEANAILDRIDAVTYTDAAAKDRAIGEAKFNRALHYFNLVRLFGDVPLFLHEVNTYSEAFSKRTAADSVYRQIIADAQDAIAKLPTRAALPAAQAGRATKGAASMLLADVYVTRKQWQDAANVLQTVLGMGYSLVTPYERNFDPTTKNGAESIFEVQFSESVVGQGSQYIYRFAPFNSGNALTSGFNDLTINQAGWNIPTRDLIAAYEPGDLRKAASIGWYRNAANTQYTDVAVGDSIPYIRKYAQPFAQAGRQGNDFPIYRYAETLLLYAEALNELNRTSEAYQYVNQVRARAGLGALAAGLSQAQFRDAVWKEERVELAFEDKRWFQLLRAGTAVQVLNAQGAALKAQTTRRSSVSYNVTPAMLLYPIPLREISLNGFAQNPGY